MYDRAKHTRLELLIWHEVWRWWFRMHRAAKQDARDMATCFWLLSTLAENHEIVNNYCYIDIYTRHVSYKIVHSRDQLLQPQPGPIVGSLMQVYWGRIEYLLGGGDQGLLLAETLPITIVQWTRVRRAARPDHDQPIGSWTVLKSPFCGHHRSGRVAQ